MTFQQYLENLSVWNTRRPFADVNVTADYSEDHDDASHFLLPFMRKIKAYYWYCEAAAEEFRRPAAKTPPERSRQQSLSPRTGRAAALYNLVGTKTDNYNEIVHSLNSLRSSFKDFYDILEAVIEDGKDSIFTIKECLTEYENVISWLQSTISATERMGQSTSSLNLNKTLKRILNFLETAEPRLNSILNLKISKMKPVGFYGHQY